MEKLPELDAFYTEPTVVYSSVDNCCAICKAPMEDNAIQDHDEDVWVDGIAVNICSDRCMALLPVSWSYSRH